MTEQELEMFRLNVKIEALNALVRGLYTGLANSSPAAAEALKMQFANLRKEHGQLVIDGIDPALSDMFSSEYQEALNDLLSYIESGIHS